MRNEHAPSPPVPLSRTAREGETWRQRRVRMVRAAKELRRAQTPAEEVLWQQLRRDQLGGHRFRRQHPIGGYVADFACAEHKLVVELDGAVHDGQIEEDARRTEFVESLGWRVIRFGNESVFTDLDAVLSRILNELRSPSLAERERGLGGEGASRWETGAEPSGEGAPP